MWIQKFRTALKNRRESQFRKVLEDSLEKINKARDTDAPMVILRVPRKFQSQIVKELSDRNIKTNAKLGQIVVTIAPYLHFRWDA